MGNNISTDRTTTNEKNTNNQYDKGYKRELSKKKELIHFLRKYVKAPWTAKLKPENITLCDKEFILQDYEKREADLVFQVTLGERSFYLYLIMELQSSVDFTMPFRLLVYMTNLWLKIFSGFPKKERERKGFRLPVILPIVFYNGNDPWTVERQFAAYQNGSEEFRNHIVDFEYYLVNLTQINEEDILSTNTLIDNIMALDKGSRGKQDFPSFLEELAGRLSRLSQADQADFVDWMNYVLTGKELSDEYIQSFVETMKKGGFNTMMTHGLELLFDEKEEAGRKKGRMEGRKEGRMEGRKEGRMEGRKEGRMEGRKEGRMEGRKEGRMEGLRLLKQITHDTDISPELVAKAYNISLEDAIALLEKAEEK